MPCSLGLHEPSFSFQLLGTTTTYYVYELHWQFQVQGQLELELQVIKLPLAVQCITVLVKLEGMLKSPGPNQAFESRPVVW